MRCSFWGFFHLGGVKQLFLYKFYCLWRAEILKKILKNKIFLFPWARIDFFTSLKCLRLYLFIWNYSGKSFPKLAWDGKWGCLQSQAHLVFPLTIIWSKIWANTCCLLMELLHANTVICIDIWITRIWGLNLDWQNTHVRTHKIFQGPNVDSGA